MNGMTSAKTSLYADTRFRYLVAANVSSSIGLGITMIAIPWLLVSSPGGNQILGYITLAMTIFNFIMTPLIGGLIDRVSRKKLLIIGEIAGLLIMLFFSLLGFMNQTYDVWHYIVVCVTGSLYYTIFYPTMFAFTQECFEKQYYKTLNGAMEVQSQLASMIAGGIASILIMKMELQWILLINSLTYLMAIIFFMKVRLVKRSETLLQPVTEQKKMIAGFTYVWKYPIMFYFLLCTTFPFIGVMITNFLFPVYLQQVHNASAWVYGVETMIYCLGAVCAGLLIPIISQKIGNEKTMIISVFCYTMAISLIVFADIPLFLCLMFFLALGNAGSRVARQTFMMEHIPNEYIGRVDSVIRLIGLFIRVLLLALFTKLVSLQSVIICFVLLSGILCLASISVYLLWKRGLFLKKEHLLVKGEG
ncbi:MAG: MFS transporter [Lysinibacillus sp.]